MISHIIYWFVCFRALLFTHQPQHYLLLHNLQQFNKSAKNCGLIWLHFFYIDNSTFLLHLLLARRGKYNECISTGFAAGASSMCGGSDVQRPALVSWLVSWRQEGARLVCYIGG